MKMKYPVFTEQHDELQDGKFLVNIWVSHNSLKFLSGHFKS